MTRWILASLHLLALPIGLGAVWMRSRYLRQLGDRSSFQRVFTTDSLWALAAALWLATGLLRAFGGLEKGGSYYLGQPVFHIKMTLFLLVFLLELRPMFTLMSWRRRIARGEIPDTRAARALATISRIQVIITGLMIFAATALARGMFAR